MLLLLLAKALEITKNGGDDENESFLALIWVSIGKERKWGKIAGLYHHRLHNGILGGPVGMMSWGLIFIFNLFVNDELESSSYRSSGRKGRLRNRCFWGLYVLAE